MKKNNLLFTMFQTVLMIVALNFNSTGQVVINEILPNGTVELLNTGTSTVDVSTYWLCDQPAYQRLDDSNIIAGSLNLGPGEILAVDDFTTLNNNDGEVGLYINSQFSNPNSLLDYVEWGFHGHGRSDEAETAGIWTAGDFVPAFGASESIAYSGTGDTSASWTAGTPTIGDENFTTDECVANAGTIALSAAFGGGDEYDGCANSFDIQAITVDITGTPTGDLIGYVIVDRDSQIILGAPTSQPLDLSQAPPGTCDIYMIAGCGTITGFAAGEPFADLAGDFVLSNSVAVNRIEPDGGDISFSDGSTEAFICIDGVPDPLGVIHTTTAPELTFDYVVTDDNDIILSIFTDSPIDLDGAGPGTCRIWGWSYRGLDGPSFIGGPLQDLRDAECSDISDEFLTVVREEPDGGDISFSDGSTEASICIDGNPDPLGVVHTTTAPNLTFDYVVTDDNDIILSIFTDSPIDLDGAGPGTCRIWGWSYRGLDGPSFIGGPLQDLRDADCSDISEEFLTVIREIPDGGDISFSDGSTEASICVDGVPDPLDVIHTTTAPNLTFDYVITDDNDIILSIFTDSPIDLDGAGPGTCRIWGWSYRGLDGPSFIGGPLQDLRDADCSDISDEFLTVVRNAPGEGGCPVIDDNAPQCPPVDTVLRSQEDIDAFAAAYPNCTNIPVGIFITEDQATPGTVMDFSPLSFIETIDSYLVFWRVTSSTDFSGFENLTSVGGFLGLNSMVNVTSLNGLQNVETVGSLQLTSMRGVTSLEELSSLQTIEDQVVISTNRNLTTCSIDAICTLLDAGGSARVFNNGAGCNSASDIEAGCGTGFQVDDFDDPVITVFPNPVQSSINITDIELTSSSATINVIDRLGQVVQSVNELNQFNKGTLSFDVNGLASGFYYLEVLDGDKRYTTTFFKQ